MGRRAAESLPGRITTTSLRALLAPPFVWPLVLLATVATLFGVFSAVRNGVVGPRGGRVYYDAYHGARHLWNRHNHRHHHAYHTVSGYGRFVDALREEGFEVDVATAHGFDRGILDQYDVFFIGEQTHHGRFMTEREVEDLRDWVEDGGGLYITAEHSNAYNMAETFNRVMEGFPVRARRDTIDDREQVRRPFSSDWPILSSPPNAPHPVGDGIDEYMHYAGCSFDSPHGILFSSPTSWADYYQAHDPPIYNGDTKHQDTEPRGPHAGVVAFEQGAGRVVASGDHNALSNPNLYWGDHYRYALQAIGWLAGDRLNRDVLVGFGGLVVLLLCWRRRRVQARAFGGAIAAGLGLTVILLGALHVSRPRHRDLLLYRGNAPAMNLMTKVSSGHYSFNGVLTKERDIRPWASPRMRPGMDALALVAPTTELDPVDLEVLDEYLRSGKSVLYLANRKSLESAAGAQLQEHFEFKVELSSSVGGLRRKDERQPYLLHGPADMLAGIFRFWVRHSTPGALVDGLEPVVHLTPGSAHIEDEAWTDENAVIHLLSERKVGDGTFMLLTPMELFDTASLGELYEVGDPIQEQMAEFALRVIERATAP